jgi:alpha-glucuronidase
MTWKRCIGVWLASTLACTAARAETGRAAWLRYAPLPDATAAQDRAVLPPAVTTLTDDSPIVLNARDEIARGVRGILGRILREERGTPSSPAIVLCRRAECRATYPSLPLDAHLEADGYWLKTVSVGADHLLLVTSDSDRGVLYGAFALLRTIALGRPIANLDEQQSPSSPLRWVNQWDNLDGTIERGYGGRSIFWDEGRARDDLTRVREYARLLASLGINAVSINNVNANPRVLSPDLIPDVTRIANAMRPWGVRVALAIDFGSPQSLGGLDTYDPLDPRVGAWWRARADDLYRAIPDFAGFVLKADSEGRVGPSAYNRTHADAANVVARALKPHGGVIFYRGFVYDHHMDWRDPKNDRARAAYDNFHELDGRFDDNVVVQIKHGPIDFQVREPASPLFGALERTNVAIELQITQEYMGQARHTVFLVPMWKEALDFDLRVNGTATPVKAVAAGRTFHRPLGGFVGVANAGMDENWFGNHLSQANLYGFGRLAWNPDLATRDLAEEWTRLTFGTEPIVVRTIADLQAGSWRTYENYTGPLGLQTLTDIVGNHYGVAVEASERNGWGQWHRADDKGVGMDRTVATGTGFIGQYRPEAARVYESLASCPDDLLLFMHHVPYTYVLHSGKTVIQSIYDSHYDGAAAVAEYVRAWTMLKGHVDDDRYEAVLAQLTYQSGQAIVWRDAVTTWFARASAIRDVKGRVGKYPGRLEAESAALDGYTAVDVTPWEAASGGRAIECRSSSCAATFQFDGPAGWYDVTVQYFDVNTGAARFKLLRGAQVVDEWIASDRVPTRKIDGSSSARRVVRGVSLQPGDAIRIEGTPDEGETAALDYIEITAPSRAAAPARSTRPAPKGTPPARPSGR